MLPNNQPNTMPAWMNRQKPARQGVPYNMMPLPRLPQVPAWMPPAMKGQAGYYQTGDNERKIVMLNGQKVRMGPNSYIEPNRKPKNGWQQIWEILNGGGLDVENPSGIAGVRG